MPEAIIIDRILRGYIDQTGLSRKAAALKLGISPHRLERWLEGGGCPQEAWAESISDKLQVTSVEEANLRYTRDVDSVTCFSSLHDNLERVFLAHLHRATLLRETRMMAPQYPYSKDRIFPRMKAEVYERLRNASLTVHKVEQICSLKRVVDLLHNARTFPIDRYEAKILPYRSFFPYTNFGLFDHRSVIAATFDEQGTSATVPFMSYLGKQFADFYEIVWDGLWHRSGAKAVTKSDGLDLVVQYLQEIPEEDCKSITTEKLEKMVVERGTFSNDYAPRY